jgi:hypothetical protein
MTHAKQHDQFTSTTHAAAEFTFNPRGMLWVKKEEPGVSSEALTTN